MVSDLKIWLLLVSRLADIRLLQWVGADIIRMSIDRAFKGEIASRMDQLTTRGLEAQVESANLDRENA